MKKRPLVLILLLLLLLFLIPKDVTAAYNDESSESITSFSETLAHDQMYYPDDEDCLGFGGYFESFKDVSDWNTDTGNGISSNGDISTIEVDGDEVYDRYDCNTPSAADYNGSYIEFRWKSNVSSGLTFLLVLKTGDDYGGETLFAWSLQNYGYTADTWKTYKVLYVPSNSGTAECVSVVPKCTSNVKLEFDYLRIGPADELGFQHDGSTTGNITADGVSLGSDADLLTVTNLNSGNKRAVFDIDSTATHAKIDPDYYPMLALSVSSVTDGGSDNEVYRVQVFSDGWYEVLPIGDSTGVSYANIYAVTTADIEHIAVQMEDINDVVIIDWIKIYSIANFTVTYDNVAANDVFYVDDSNALVQTGDVVGWMNFRYDITPNVYTSIFNVWNATLPVGSEYFRFRHYVGSWEWEDVGETGGDMPYGTLEIFEIRIYGAFSLSAIKFIEKREWQEANYAEFILRVKWSPEIQFGYDAIFIFLGLVMIPASTMYLARGGRKAMSTDKLFYGLVIFFLGIGFLIGGILP